MFSFCPVGVAVFASCPSGQRKVTVFTVVGFYKRLYWFLIPLIHEENNFIVAC